MAELVSHHARVIRRVRSHTKVGVLQVQSRIVPPETRERIIVRESPEGVIQEIEGLGPELEALRFTDLEILENGQIAVGEQWSVDVRDAVTSVVPWRRRLEAGGI